MNRYSIAGIKNLPDLVNRLQNYLSHISGSFDNHDTRLNDLTSRLTRLEQQANAGQTAQNQ